MKRFLLSTAAALALTTAASAADLPARVAPPPPLVPVPVFTWTGFYVGVHGMWIRNDVDAHRTNTSALVRPFIPRHVSLYDDGFGGGGQIGYNMQFGNIVAGIEADISVVDIERRAQRTVQIFGPFGVRTQLRTQMDFFGTVKGRVGFSFPSFLPFFQQSMVYVTGGLAYADFEHRANVSLLGPGGTTFRTSHDDTKFGWTIGGGTESAITNNISIKTETLYYDLGEETLTRRGPFGLRAGYRYENDGWLSRVGVNFRF